MNMGMAGGGGGNMMGMSGGMGNMGGGPPPMNGCVVIVSNLDEGVCFHGFCRLFNDRSKHARADLVQIFQVCVALPHE